MQLDSNLKKRLWVALGGIPCVICVLFFAPMWGKKTACFLLTIMMAYEWAKMTRAPFAMLSLSLLSLGMFALPYVHSFPMYALGMDVACHLHQGLAYILLLIPFVLIYLRQQSLFTIGSLYILGSMFILTHLLEDPSHVLWMLLLIWGNDSFAYFVGKSLKGPKLWVRISPNKTWSGFLGGVILGGAAAGMVADFYALTPYPYLVSIFLSIIGHGGDLVESAVKRHYGVKDSGSILPGHGGILDRLDSLLSVLWGYGLLKAIDFFIH